ncbi:ABC transporter substrate-binding protein [Streptomyces sp. NBC_01304]|uniref:ABC transporter substrate-binding protein n=1 Tax=Streptomyces sp. NBC_01304 TaxID=2903818 RepID=UPI002E101D28|nr:ABC transporter substrate-binding protein [Streptomyces sp. NBC_01304]
MTGTQREAATSIAWDPVDSRGPARPVEGAERGGTLRILRDGDYDHLDPQRIHTLQSTALGQLLYRTLTMFAEDGRGGWTLVGDLADSPGRDVHGDARTWEFTLKDGIRFEDGRPVTAADVAHGIARSFEQSLPGGPTHLQDWLRENGDYPGPHTSGSDQVPGLEVRGARTLVFRFRDPHPDLPMAVSLATTAPVPADVDTGESYGKAPLASGSYRIADHVPDERLILERNPHWSAATDAVRHDHVDRIHIELGVDAEQQTVRARGDQGDDTFAVGENQAPAELAPELLADTSLQGRLRRDPTPLVWYLAVNTARVTNSSVRRALATAVDRGAVRDAMLDPTQGALVHTLLSPGTIGYRAYPDPHGAGPHGDPEAARALLAGATPTLRLLSRDGAYFTGACRAVADSLERAGFRVEVVEIDRPSHNAAALAKDNEYDLYMMATAADWPGASTLLTAFDGRTIRPTGNANFTYLDDPDINAEIDRISALPADLAAPEWGALDERLTTHQVPLIPLYSYVHLAVSGSRVGGVFTSSYLGTPVYYDAYVTGSGAAEGAGGRP